MPAAKITGKIALYFAVSAISIGMTIPFLYMLTSSMKTTPETLQFPPVWLPKAWIWENYVQIWKQTELFQWFRNSLFIASARVASQVVTCSLAAYAFSFLHFRGKHIVFLCTLAVLMVPHQVVIIPQFLLLKEFGWLDSFKGLIIPSMVGAFSIFLFRQSFMTMPSEMIEAAKLDGCNPLSTLVRIVMPNSKSVLTTMILVTFLSHWNDFMWPLIITKSKTMMVLPVGMANMVGEFSTDWPMLMTVATYATLPIIVLFVFGQRYFVEGMLTAGIK
ncbi:carbohydrate ABC transporter permease [Paenibacillus sp. MBLB4367]|uniref:carbohydrate ABC transporter permease n=1 Tax=Paenibacillus sp. MBLB4367 TaxID=3384767 RepID=UPI0039082CE3